MGRQATAAEARNCLLGLGMLVIFNELENVVGEGAEKRSLGTRFSKPNAKTSTVSRSCLGRELQFEFCITK